MQTTTEKAFPICPFLCKQLHVSHVTESELLKMDMSQLLTVNKLLPI